MPNYCELRLYPTHHRSVIFGTEVRSALKRAWHNDHQLFPAELFNYEDPEHTFTAQPTIRFGGGPGCGRIYALGQDAMDLLSAHQETIAEVFGAHLRDTVQSRLLTGECSAQPTSSPQHYIVRKLVAQPAGDTGFEIARRAKAGELPLAEQIRLAEFLVTRGLEEQSQMLGLPKLALEGLSITSINGFRPVQIEHPIYRLALQDVRFTLNHRLTGPWHVGFLRARGYGLLQEGRRPHEQRNGRRRAS